MFIASCCSLAMVFCLVSMLCRDSWKGVWKLAGKTLMLWTLVCIGTPGLSAQGVAEGVGTTAAEPYSITATFHDSSKDQYGINWHSKAAYTKPRIQYTKTVNGEKSVADNVTSYARSGYYVYKGVLSDLEPGEKYYYRVGDADSGVWSDWGSFQTEAGGNTAFTFFHMTFVGSIHNQLPDSFLSAFHAIKPSNHYCMFFAISFYFKHD